MLFKALCWTLPDCLSTLIDRHLASRVQVQEVEGVISMDYVMVRRVDMWQVGSCLI